MDVEYEVDLFRVANVKEMVIGKLREHCDLQSALHMGNFYLLNVTEQQEVLKHIKFVCYSL